MFRCAIDAKMQLGERLEVVLQACISSKIGIEKVGLSVRARVGSCPLEAQDNHPLLLLCNCLDPAKVNADPAD